MRADQPVIHRAAKVIDPWSLRTHLTDAAVAVGAGQVLAVDHWSSVRSQYPTAIVVDHGERWIAPGLVNAHGHLAGWPRDERLELFLVERYVALDMEYIHNMAAYTAGALATSGVTSTHHLHYGPGGLEAIAGYRRVGVKVEFCQGALDRFSVLPHDTGNRKLLCALTPSERDLVQGRTLGKESQPVDEYLRRWEVIREAADHPNVRLGLGPDNPEWCTDELLRVLAERGEPMHMHVQETESQLTGAIAATGMSGVARLSQLGLLGEQLTVAHLTHCSDDDLALVADSGTHVVVSPSSNLRLGSGIPPLARMMEHGITPALGTDGGGFVDDLDLWHEVRLATYLWRAQVRDFCSADDVKFLQMVMGDLAVGGDADFLVIDAVRAPDGDPVGALVNRADRSSVNDVYVDGVAIVRDKELVGAGLPVTDPTPERVNSVADVLRPVLPQRR
jgi:5-methylthioadenosine/S-adenosylhomocysteine deaminase